MSGVLCKFFFFFSSFVSIGIPARKIKTHAQTPILTPFFSKLSDLSI